MTALDDFKQFIVDAETGSQYAKWAQQNPGEVARWSAFKSGILAGAFPGAPAMTTPHGRELVDAGLLTEHFEQAVAPVTPPPPPPPPPAPGVTPQWDGAAAQMTVMPTTSGDGNATTVSPQPVPGPWRGYVYQGDDISLAASTRFGKVYDVHPAAGHRNPWNTGAPAGATAAQISMVRPTANGATYWYSDSIHVKSDGFVAPDWGTFISLGYETIQYDQITIGVYGSDFAVAQNAGLIVGGGGSNHYGQRLFPLPLDKDLDVVAGVKWSTQSDGWFELWTRIAGGAWTKSWRKDGPTYAYGSTSYTTISADMHECSTVLDKEGLYFGWWNQAQVPAPTAKVLLRGFQRFGALADAQASLG